MDKEAILMGLERAALVNFKEEELQTIDRKLWKLLADDVGDVIACPQSEFEEKLSAPLSSVSFLLKRGRQEKHGERVRLERLVLAFIFGARAVYHIGQEEPEPCEQPTAEAGDDDDDGIDNTGDAEDLEGIAERA